MSRRRTRCEDPEESCIVPSTRSSQRLARSPCWEPNCYILRSGTNLVEARSPRRAPRQSYRESEPVQARQGAQAHRAGGSQGPTRTTILLRLYCVDDRTSRGSGQGEGRVSAKVRPCASQTRLKRLRMRQSRSQQTMPPPGIVSNPRVAFPCFRDLILDLSKRVAMASPRRVR